MKLNNIIFTGVIATNAMTLYSYVISEIKNKNFSEPDTLADVIHSLIPGIKKRYAFVAGWSAHYLAGITFAIVYSYLWQNKGIRPTIQNGLVLGGVSGIIAIAVWRTVIGVNPDPPSRHYKRYYMQLLPAHVVFAISACLAYSMYKSETPPDHET